MHRQVRQEQLSSPLVVVVQGSRGTTPLHDGLAGPGYQRWQPQHNLQPAIRPSTEHARDGPAIHGGPTWHHIEVLADRHKELVRGRGADGTDSRWRTVNASVPSQ